MTYVYPNWFFVYTPKSAEHVLQLESRYCFKHDLAVVYEGMKLKCLEPFECSICKLSVTVLSIVPTHG